MKTLTSFRATTRNPFLKILPRLFAVFGLLMMFAVSGWGANTDLSITKSVSDSTPTVGDTVIFTIVGTNNGPTTTDISITDTLPAGLTWLSDSENKSNFSCSNVGNAVTCTGAQDFSTDEAVTVTIEARVDSAGAITNSASIVPISAGVTDTITTGNNSASVNLTATSPNADLSITKSVDDSTPTVGQDVTFTIVGRNNGPTTTDITITDTLPAGLIWVSDSENKSSFDCTNVGNAVTCTGTQDFTTDETVTITIIARVDSAGAITNTASIAPITAGVTDTVTTGNNSASVSLTATATANLALTNTDSSDPIFTNRTVTYALRVTNSGPQNTNNLILTDSVSNGTITAVSGDGWSCTHTATTATCTKSSLSTGVTANTVSVSVTAPTSGGTITNSASVSATEADPDPANNTSIVQTTEVRQLIEATAQDVCYSEITYTGMMCIDFGLFKGGIGCRQTIPLKNISGTALSSVNTFIDVSGISGSMFSDCGIDGTSGDCEQQNNIDFGPIGIFTKGISYSMPNYSVDASHTIYETSLMSMAIFSGSNLYTTYEKNGEYYSSQISACPVEISWEQLTYETSEDTNLAYGYSSQMPMRIMIDHVVDYPISVSYATHNGTAIGDSDYRISSGTVTIPAGETSVTINMDIYHDEAIELTENFTVTLTNPTGSGGVTLKTGYDVATVRIMEQNTAPMCYSDNFNTGTATDNDWRVLQNQGITPGYVNGKMRLTDSGTHQASAITKDFEFPSSGNIIITEFTYYSYAGSGADGIGLVLYDSEVGASPWVGVTGGSLGYAQGSNVYTACQPNGCPGFEGGWLGLGLDEYGNYSNPNEGRTGTGTNSGFHADAASIRGKGNSADGYMSGYTYLAGTGTMATSLDRPAPNTNPLPGDKYRMTVDARNSAHLYISLERMIGGVGTYQTIISQFDAIESQGASPEFIRLALTGSTGGSTNIHEIDNMTVWGRCTTYNPSTDNPTAVGFDARETSILMADNNRSITTKISDKPFQLNVVSLGTDGALAAYDGVNNNRVYLFEENNATCSLSASERLTAIASKPRDWYVTFNQDDTNKVTPNHTSSTASKDKRIMMNFMNWSQAFSDASFNCSNSNTQAVLKGVPQCLNSNTKLRQVFSTLVANTCLGGSKPACESNSYANGVPDYPYNNEFGCYQCLAGGAGTTTCSTDNFAIRPDRFEFSSATLMRAGEDYNLTVNAKNFGTTVNTTDYNQTVSNLSGAPKSWWNRDTAAQIMTVNTQGITTIAGNWNFTNGTGSVPIRFSDVGKFTLDLNDTNWAAVDIDDTPLSDLTLHGDGNVTFVPWDFNISTGAIVNNDGTSPSFTYLSRDLNMSARIPMTIRAQNKQGATTLNYANNMYERSITITPYVSSVAATARGLTPITLGANNADGNFISGTATILFNDPLVARFNFDRNQTIAVSPFDVNSSNGIGNDVNITVTDSDSVYGDKNQTLGGNATFVYGRFIPRDVRVFGANKAFTANGWYEVFNTPRIGTNGLPLSRNGNGWYINTFHSDQLANYDGDANVTYINATLQVPNIGGAVGVDGIEDYASGGMALGNYKAHINTDPWLWYGQNASTYADPNGINGCDTHPCFNISIVPPMGASGSAKADAQGQKDNKSSSSSSGSTGFKSTNDYAPAVR